MNQKQINEMVKQGWPKPAFKVGEVVRHWDRDFDSPIERIGIDDKWLNDYGVKGWVYSNSSCEEPWWGRESDLVVAGQ